MAKGIQGGVDIINTLHQKNDSNFYIAYASDILYDTDGRTKDTSILDTIDNINKKSPYSIKVTIQKSAWSNTNKYDIDLTKYLTETILRDSTVIVTPFDNSEHNVEIAKACIEIYNKGTTLYLIRNGQQITFDMDLTITVIPVNSKNVITTTTT